MTVMNDQPIEKVQFFIFLGCKLLNWTIDDIDWEIT
jgi:hypothetical protein